MGLAGSAVVAQNTDCAAHEGGLPPERRWEGYLWCRAPRLEGHRCGRVAGDPGCAGPPRGARRGPLAGA
eukprot:10493864-Lingulodinium_polyedra.AAC.1